ncbi:MAG: FAD-dependent oxidoreductase, partial [Acidobacteria bacterium]|nr:FAD-dependent oxidoreductase [Acidobacteriota bacterium]
MAYDIAVIGAGVFGAWCAHFFRAAGLSVVLVEQHSPGNALSSSGGESRIIRMSYGGDEIYTRMAWRSLELWRALFAATGDDLFVPTGVLWLARREEAGASASEATLARLGIQAERLDAEELRRRFPQISFAGIDWGLYEPGSGVLMARRAVAAVARAAVRNGAAYKSAAVVPPAGQSASGRLASIQTLNGDSIAAGEFVFCCGAWLPGVFPDVLGSRMFITRQEVFFFGTPAGDTSFRPPQFPTWLEMSAGMYGMPDLEGRGAKLALDSHGPLMDPDRDERAPSAAALQLARDYLHNRFPRLRNAPLAEARVCQYENTSSGDFIIDRHPRHENLWMVGGGSGHGFKHGPAVGEYVAGLIAGER